MSKRPFVSAITGFVLVASLFAPTLARADKGDGHRKLDRVCEQITCSEQQKQDIARIFEQMHVDLEVDREAIESLRKQLATEWVKDRPNQRTLDKLADDIAAHERNIADRRMAAMMEQHALLSAEQRK
ncbi:MAG: hypothetical protein KC457_03625 [Myxococcales bacterium]|nr:hypothetical protein [Myxococcales bacterium]